MAVVTGVRSINFIKTHITQQVHAVELLRDSQCTLNWLESKKPFPVFVRNWVGKVRKSQDITYHYVKSKDNPADLAIRGCGIQELKTNAL